MNSSTPNEPGRIAKIASNSWLLALIIAIAAAAWMASGILAPSTASDEETAAAEQQVAALTQVRVATFTAEPVSDSLRLQGRTKADRRVTISAETSGTISDLLVRRGSAVEANQVIAQLSTDDRNARVASAKAFLAQRETEFDAAQRLNQKGFRGDVDLSQAQAALDAARADVELAEIELERTTIQAPFAGVMFERDVELGDFVDRGDPIAYIVDLSVITAVAQVSERNLGQVSLGQQATVRTLRGEPLEGVVSYIGTVADDVTRTFPIEVDVPNSDGTLIEGVTVELLLPMNELKAHSITPAILTLDDEGNVGVRGVNQIDEVIFYPVTILRDAIDSVLVGGLPDQVRLITVGQEFVRDGQAVLAVDEAQVAAGGENS